MAKFSIGKPTRTSAEPPVDPDRHECGILLSLSANCRLSLLHPTQEKLNEAVMVLNKNLQEINIKNMNVELVAQMFRNYRSNVQFHLEGTGDPKTLMSLLASIEVLIILLTYLATGGLQKPS